MKMGTPQRPAIRNQMDASVQDRSGRVVMNMEGQSGMPSERSKSSQHNYVNGFSSKKMPVRDSRLPDTSINGTRSGSVGMRQRMMMSRNESAVNVEQSVNMTKFGGKTKKAALETKPVQATLANAETQYQITGEQKQEHIQQVDGVNFMDQSVELTPENIL